ncbi:MAG: hypothetical protein ACE5HY_02640 [Candidatus Hydrothermarchaeales archaeon]
MPEKGKVPPGLKPREPVKVPKDVFKTLPADVQKLLKDLNAAREEDNKDKQREVRKALRAKGFYLSNLEDGGAPPEKKAKKAETAKAKATAVVEEDDEEEEDE